MQARYYCDFYAPSYPVRNILLSRLHAFFQTRPQCYAIEIYTKDILRIFASSPEELFALQNALSLAYPINSTISLINTVPLDFHGEWFSFRRYRIPSLKADRHRKEEYGFLRQRRMERAHEEGMDYFILRSHSTGQTFTLTILREQGRKNENECRPNSYGFCSQASLFSLPHIVLKDQN